MELTEPYQTAAPESVEKNLHSSFEALTCWLENSKSRIWGHFDVKILLTVSCSVALVRAQGR